MIDNSKIFATNNAYGMDITRATNIEKTPYKTFSFRTKRLDIQPLCSWPVQMKC